MTAAIAGPESAPAILELRGLRKEYPGVVAINDVDLTLHAGEVLGLVGKNGAGKSSVIKTLAGLISADSGEIFVDGSPVTITGPEMARKLGLAFVHQELALVPQLSVAENLYLGLGYPGHGVINWRRLKRSTAAVLERLDAANLAGRKVGELSVAQQRLVMIGRALAQDARLVVLDEPTASLTDEEITHVFSVIRSLKRHGIGVVYVSHRLDEIFALTDRVVTMRDGRVVADSRTSDLTMRQLVAGMTGNAGRAEDVVSREHVRARERGEAALSASGLGRRQLLHDVEITLHKGEVLGLAGLVGSGRTELARLLFGVDRPTSGEISVRGKQVALRSPRTAMKHGIVLLPEDRKSLGNVVDMSIRRNMTLPNLKSHRRFGHLPFPNPAKERRSARQMIRELSVATSEDTKPVGLLSGGNQQKVVLAKWLLHGADVFMFDEPTHGIDVDGKNEVYALIDRLADQGKAVLFISSEFPEMVAVCDRVLVLREGTVVAELTGNDITEDRMLAACYAHEESEGSDADQPREPTA